MLDPATTDTAPRRGAGLCVVGLGASAGGLAALEAFLSHVPPASGLAYVVVQHLDPTSKALLPGLLQRGTAMPVREATDGLALAPDAVFVVPPGHDLTCEHGRLRLWPPTQPRGLRLPIDRLFASLAHDQGARAVGVVLSGMGADGTLGLQAIRAQGGLALAQSPESAAFDAMPRHAIAAGAADLVGEPAALPALLLARLAQRRDGVLAAPGPDGGGPDDAQALAAVVEALRQRSRHDLSHYKPSTLQRRVQRRMAVHGVGTVAAYADFVRRNPQELDLLFKEMLIGVTQFFRDPPVWEELKASVLPALLDRAEPGGRLRAWVAGCSTGEEAYTLAMVFEEVAAARPGARRTLQIFASDLSADAIAFARRGVYPASVADDLDPDRLARFFTRQGDSLVVTKALREMVLFAQHDIILDPPFTRLDLLSCRNLLIYFDAPLQRRLLPLFSYSLRPDGALLLGNSETVGPALGQFTPLGGKARLYWRQHHPLRPADLAFPSGPGRALRLAPDAAPETDVTPTAPTPSTSLQALVEQTLLRAHTPAAVLVNDQGDVLYIHGSVGRYLEPAAGKANWNLHAMARPPLRSQIAAAMRQLLLDGQPAVLRALALDDADPTRLDIALQPLPHGAGTPALVLVVFQDRPAPPAARRRRAGTPDPELAAELRRLQDEVLSLRQEMGASAEELQAANEELQSTNEELQSANEELTTSKEESQSMNEELQTLNGELQQKLDDLALAQSDMQNLLNSTEIATLFLDNALNVRRYTDQITRIVHLREGDIGRPLTDLASTLLYPDLHDDAKETLRTLSFTEKQIATTDGQWYLVRIKPYRTLSNVIQGVVITLVDITAAKALEARLRQAQAT